MLRTCSPSTASYGSLSLINHCLTLFSSGELLCHHHPTAGTALSFCYARKKGARLERCATMQLGSCSFSFGRELNTSKVARSPSRPDLAQFFFFLTFLNRQALICFLAWCNSIRMHRYPCTQAASFSCTSIWRLWEAKCKLFLVVQCKSLLTAHCPSRPFPFAAASLSWVVQITFLLLQQGQGWA